MISANDFTPIDIAGFCNNVATVKAFCLHLESRIDSRSESKKSKEAATTEGG